MLHEDVGVFFEIFPIDLDNFVVELAFLGVLGGSWNFVDNFFTWDNTLKGVSRGAFGHEFGENGRVNAATKG